MRRLSQTPVGFLKWVDVLNRMDSLNQVGFRNRASYLNQVEFLGRVGFLKRVGFLNQASLLNQVDSQSQVGFRNRAHYPTQANFLIQVDLLNQASSLNQVDCLGRLDLPSQVSFRDQETCLGRAGEGRLEKASVGLARMVALGRVERVVADPPEPLAAAQVGQAALRAADLVIRRLPLEEQSADAEDQGSTVEWCRLVAVRLPR